MHSVVRDPEPRHLGADILTVEQCQNFAHLTWSEDEVNDRVVRLMRDAYGRLRDTAESLGIRHRLAATVLGLRTIVDAHHLRGLSPS